MQTNERPDLYPSSVILFGPPQPERLELKKLLSNDVLYFDPEVGNNNVWSPINQEQKDECLKVCPYMLYMLPSTFDPSDCFEVGCLSQNFKNKFMLLYPGKSNNKVIPQIINTVLSLGGGVFTTPDDAAQTLNSIYKKNPAYTL